jgi:hypothetical protein
LQAGPLTNTNPRPAIYDTWSSTYMARGGNFFDDDGIMGVDNLNEQGTPPPYNEPLKGLQITIRVYEPSSRTVREVTIERSFAD